MKANAEKQINCSNIQPCWYSRGFYSIEYQQEHFFASLSDKSIYSAQHITKQIGDTAPFIK